MAKTAQLAASPMQIALGDKTFTLRPLTDIDIGELDNWLASRIIRMARESLPVNATQAERVETMEIAFRLASTMTWYSDEGSKILGGTLDGVARLLWQLTKVDHPEATVDDLRKRILDPRTLQAAVDAFNYLARSSSPESSKELPEPSQDREVIYQALMSRYGWTPVEVASLTPQQQQLCLGLPVDSVVRFDTIQQVRAYQASVKADK